MPEMLLEIPARIEAGRTYLRRYEAGDGHWYYTMSQQIVGVIVYHLGFGG